MANLYKIRMRGLSDSDYSIEVEWGNQVVQATWTLDQAKLDELSADPERYGDFLTQSVFRNPALANHYQLARMNQKGQLPIRIDLNGDGLERLAWERLRPPTGGDEPLSRAGDTRFARLVHAIEMKPPIEIVPQEKIKILTVIANPTADFQLPSIDPQEWLEIAKLLPSEKFEWVGLQSADPDPTHRPTVQNIERELQSGHYAILHFLCHGVMDRENRPNLILEDQAGRSTVVPAQTIVKLLTFPNAPLLCFLTACHSGERGGAAELPALGEQLVLEGNVAAAVSMSQRVTMRQARDFARQFYRQLARHGLVDLAVNEARAFASKGEARWDDASIPILHLRSADANDSRLWWSLEQPYRGLESYTAKEQKWFFGREKESAELLAKLRENHFVALIGVSGSGKSSLVQAGIVPQWGDATWICRPNSSPLTALAKMMNATSDDFAEQKRATTELAQAMATQPTALAEAINRRVSAEQIKRPLLIIDQGEELVAQCRDETERRIFIANLDYAAKNTAVTILFVLREDFTGMLTPYLGEKLRLFSAERYTLRGLSQTGLEEVIVKPAELCGVTIDSADTQALIREVGAQESGRLPLLSYLLENAWKNRHGDQLTLQQLHNLGGFDQIIEKRLKLVLSGKEEKERLRNVIVRLVEIGTDPNSPKTRRRTADSQLLSLAKTGESPAPERTKQLLDQLSTERLFIQIEPESNDPNLPHQYEITHEILINDWERLKEWLKEPHLRAQRQLEMAAQEWDNAQRNESYLYAGEKLALARTLDAYYWLNETERAFLEASAKHEAAIVKAKKNSRRRQLILGGVALLSLLGVIGSMVRQPIWSYYLQSQAKTGWDAKLEDVNLNGKKLWVEKYEVSNRRYRLCVQDKVCEEPIVTEADSITYHRKDKAQYEYYPINGVSGEDAETFCNWIGHKLPKQEEWMKVAESITDTDFKSPRELIIDHVEELVEEGKVVIGDLSSPKPINRERLGTPEKICDLLGNVSEPLEGGKKSMGGNFKAISENFPMPPTPTSILEPSTQDEGVGIRCFSDTSK